MERVKDILFTEAMKTLGGYTDPTSTPEQIYAKWFKDCGGCVPDEYAEDLYLRIEDKFYCLLDAIRCTLAREKVIEREFEAGITVQPSCEDTTYCVLSYRGVVLLEVKAKVHHLNGMSEEEFKDMLYSWYMAARRRALSYRGLVQALEELEMARCNAEQCPEHREEAHELAELEHVDIHIEGAISALQQFLQQGEY